MSSPTTRLAIFDIDGTLTDSVEPHQSAFKQALMALGYQAFSTDWGSYPEHTDLGIFKEICQGHHAEMDGAAVAAFEQHIADNLSARDEPIGQIRDAAIFLERLQGQYDVVFATGSLLKPALIKLQQAGIAHPESLIVASNDYCSREAIVSKAIEVSMAYYGRTHYSRIVSFGDGLWDLQTAKKLQLEFVGISNPALLNHGAATFFTHFADKGLYTLLQVAWPDPEFPDRVILEQSGFVANSQKRR